MKTKRIFSLIATVIFAALILSTTVGAAESTVKTSIPRVPDGSITIDAVKDELYSKAEEQKMIEQNFTYFPLSPANTSGVFYAVYDSNYIYLYVDVTDPTIDYSNPSPDQTWNRESIGVMLDFSYNRSESYEYSYANGDLVCYVNLSGDGTIVTYHMYAPDADTGLFDKIKFSTVKDDGNGHVLYEVALPFPSQVSVAENTKFGFEVIATDAEDGTRVGCISWSPDGSEMWRYSDVIGTVTLGAAVQVAQPEPAAEPEATAEPEAPATEAPTTTTTTTTTVSPKTGSLMTAVSLMAVASAGAIARIASKKKSSK